jgi:tripartite-type tricarboxylate transporter receptor subunit TctC
MHRSSQSISVIATLIASAALALPATAQPVDFKDQPIRIVVPFSAGGGTDVVARTLAVTMAEELGRPVIVDNRPGGGTTIGSDNVAKSDPDGHTLLMATFAHAVNPSLRATMPYDTNAAFDPVVLIGRSPNILVVRADSPYQKVQDLLDAAKANPGKITYASQGVGTSAHLAGELFKNLSGTDILHSTPRQRSPPVRG